MQSNPHSHLPTSERAQAKETLIYETGVMKLADFGLSKTLPINKHASFDLESKFKLTGETGSYRYMAPEVFRHEPYNYKARQLGRGLRDGKGAITRGCLRTRLTDGYTTALTYPQLC